MHLGKSRGIIDKISDYNDFAGGQKILMEQKAVNRGVLSSANEAEERIVHSYLVLPGMEEYTRIVK